MIPFLAQFPTDSTAAFIQVIVGGSAAMFLINQALTFYKDHIKEQPTPSTTYATKDELAAVETEFKAGLTALAQDLKSEASAQAGKRKAIYQQIEELGRDMAGLKADNVTQTRQLFNVETKLDRVLERMPRKQ